LLSFLVFLVVYSGFGFTSNAVLIGPLFVLYGLYQGVFRSVGKALATDFVPPELRASGVGWYTATIGLTGLFASIVGGLLWTRIGPPATFLFGAASALVGSTGVRHDGAPSVAEGGMYILARRLRAPAQELRRAACTRRVLLTRSRRPASCYEPPRSGEVSGCEV
jgi:MFS family permease